MEIGSTVTVGTISTEKSFLPRSIKMGLKTEVFGKVFNIFEFWTRVQGMQGILQHLSIDKHLVHRILSGEKVDGETLLKISEAIKSLPRKIKMNPISRDHDKSEPNREPESFESSVSLRMFGYDVAHWLVDGEKLESLLKETDLVKISEIAKKLSSEEGLDIGMQKSVGLTGSLVVPTIAGIPLTLNSTVFLHAEIDGAVKVSAPSSSLSLLASSSKSIPSFTSSISIKPNIAFNGHVTLGTHVGPIKVFTGIKVSSESSRLSEYFSASVSYDSSTKKSEMKFSLPMSKETLLNLTVVPLNSFSISPSTKSGKYYFEMKVVSNNFTKTENETIFKSKVS